MQGKKKKKKLISEKLKVKLPKIKFRQKVLCDSQIVNNLNKIKINNFNLVTKCTLFFFSFSFFDKNQMHT